MKVLLRNIPDTDRRNFTMYIHLRSGIFTPRAALPMQRGKAPASSCGARGRRLLYYGAPAICVLTCSGKCGYNENGEFSGCL